MKDDETGTSTATATAEPVHPLEQNLTEHLSGAKDSGDESQGIADDDVLNQGDVTGESEGTGTESDEETGEGDEETFTVTQEMWDGMSEAQRDQLLATRDLLGAVSRRPDVAGTADGSDYEQAAAGDAFDQDEQQAARAIASQEARAALAALGITEQTAPILQDTMREQSRREGLGLVRDHLKGKGEHLQDEGAADLVHAVVMGTQRPNDTSSQAIDRAVKMVEGRLTGARKSGRESMKNDLGERSKAARESQGSGKAATTGAKAKKPANLREAFETHAAEFDVMMGRAPRQ